VRWSPHARFLIIAGFGNLSGELSFWDRKTCKCLGTVDAHMSVAYEWSPDSKYFLTAILFPRLRVDNGYRIWSCNGNLLHEEKIEELSLAQWRPQPADRFPAPTDADIPKKVAAAGAAKPTSTGSKYVPPSQRGAGGGAGKPAASGRSLADLAGVQERGGSQAIFSGGGGPLGAEVEGEGKNAAKNKAKKEAKKKKAAEGGGSGAAGPAFAVEEPGAPKAAAAAKGPAGAAEAAEGAMTEEKLEKKIRAVEKKLRQIGELKELKVGADAPRIAHGCHTAAACSLATRPSSRCLTCRLTAHGRPPPSLSSPQAGGKPLEKNQLDKITAEESVRAELEALQLQMKTSQDSGKWR
jgi:translation initiation factor 2A